MLMKGYRNWFSRPCTSPRPVHTAKCNDGKWVIFGDLVVRNVLGVMGEIEVHGKLHVVCYASITYAFYVLMH